MNERFITLIERYFDEQLSAVEKEEFESLLQNNKELQKEFEEQKQIKEVLKKMSLKNPSRDIWDGYWLGIYNKIERGLSWIAIFVGALIFFGYVSFEAVNAFINSTHTPPLVKTGIGILFFGVLVLIFSLIREKIFTSKHDKYKDIQR